MGVLSRVCKKAGEVKEGKEGRNEEENLMNTERGFEIKKLEAVWGGGKGVQGSGRASMWVEKEGVRREVRMV